jgi:nucleoside-diphosphate-sugar epimerase
MNIAVTGAAGKLGGSVCRALVGAGHGVMATDLRFNRELGLPITVANLLDREECYRLLDGAEVVVHLGNYPAGYGRPAAQIYSENVTMNANVFEAARELGIKKWIFSSSVQAMRGTRTLAQNRPSALAYLPIDGHAPANPSNCYGLSKVAGEQMLQHYAAAEKINAVAIRYPMLVNMDESLLEKFNASNPYPYPDEGFAYLEFRDAASLIEAIVRAPLTGYTCYAPAAEANLMRRQARDLIPEFYANVPLRKKIEQMDSLFDMSQIQRDTGWKPRYK